MLYFTIKFATNFTIRDDKFQVLSNRSNIMSNDRNFSNEIYERYFMNCLIKICCIVKFIQNTVYVYHYLVFILSLFKIILFKIIFLFKVAFFFNFKMIIR